MRSTLAEQRLGLNGRVPEKCHLGQIRPGFDENHELHALRERLGDDVDVGDEAGLDKILNVLVASLLCVVPPTRRLMFERIRF